MEKAPPYHYYCCYFIERISNMINMLLWYGNYKIPFLFQEAHII